MNTDDEHNPPVAPVNELSGIVVLPTGADTFVGELKGRGIDVSIRAVRAPDLPRAVTCGVGLRG